MSERPVDERLEFARIARMLAECSDLHGMPAEAIIAMRQAASDIMRLADVVVPVKPFVAKKDKRDGHDSR